MESNPVSPLKVVQAKQEDFFFCILQWRQIVGGRNKWSEGSNTSCVSWQQPIAEAWRASNDGPEAEATRRAPVRRTNQGLSSPSECHGSSSDRSATLAGLFLRVKVSHHSPIAALFCCCWDSCLSLRVGSGLLRSGLLQSFLKGKDTCPICLADFTCARACVRVAQSQPGHPVVQKSAPKRRHKVHPGLQIARGPLRSSRRIWWRRSRSCVKAAAHRTGSELTIINPLSLISICSVSWLERSQSPKRRAARVAGAFILPPSQPRWHAQSAHEHRHQPSSAYFTEPAPSEGSHSLLVDESAEGSSSSSSSSETQWKINMSRRKQAKPQHLRTDAEATRSGLHRDSGRCPAGLEHFYWVYCQRRSQR